MDEIIKYVGMDVHKNSIKVAIADNGRDGEVRLWGTMTNSKASLDKLVKKLDKPNVELRFVYEAGCCGYEIYYYLTEKGYKCSVIAPSLTPKKFGQRVKNDQRDAITLARLHRAGELTEIYVPDKEDISVRDMSRLREDAKDDLRRSKQRLLSFLLKEGFHYTTTKHWTKAFRRWLADIKMATSIQQTVFQELINKVEDCEFRLDRITDELRSAVDQWRFGYIVKSLQSLRGVSLIVATVLVSEVVEFERFSNPKQLMAYLGLIPSEHFFPPSSDSYNIQLDYASNLSLYTSTGVTIATTTLWSDIPILDMSHKLGLSLENNGDYLIYVERLDTNEIISLNVGTIECSRKVAFSARGDWSGSMHISFDDFYIKGILQ